jgi:4-carboxymuconolactone decarboxylase
MGFASNTRQIAAYSKKRDQPMPRLTLPAEADMTPRQKEVVDMVTAGPRGGVRGPFGAWLRSPDFAAIAQDLGAHVRFRSCLNDRVREVVICTTAASIRAQYEWYAHARIALEAGVSNETLEAIRTNATPTDLPKDEAMAYTFAEELLRTKRVSDATYSSAVAEFDEEGVVEIIGACGYYILVGLTLNVADVALPAGEPLPFPE